MYNINRKSGAMNLYRVSGKYGNYPKKLLEIKISIYSRENKCRNRQIKQTGNKQRLSSERRSISNDSVEMEIFSESRPIGVKIKQASKNLSISNAKKGSKQHKECAKIRLVKNKRFHISTSSGSPNSESITEVSRRRKNRYFNSSFLDVQVY
jgi:hypothetical protein